MTQDMRDHDHGNQYQKRVVEDNDNPQFTLEEAGISRDLSSIAQKLAAIAEAQKDGL